MSSGAAGGLGTWLEVRMPLKEANPALAWLRPTKAVLVHTTPVHTPQFTAALCGIVKEGKPPPCLSVGERVNSMGYVHTAVYLP